MRQFFLGFFQVIMRSLILMGIMLTITLSIITREFPPDFRRIARAYEQVQKFHETAPLSDENRNVGLSQTSQAIDLATSSPNTEESEIAKLNGLYEKRAMIGRALLDPKSNSKMSRSTEAASPVESGELQILRAQLLTCHDKLRLYENLDPIRSTDEDDPP